MKKWNTMELKFIDLGGLTKIGGAPTYPGGMLDEHPFFKIFLLRRR